MTDGDVVVAQEDLAHDEADDLLTLLDGELLGVGCKSGAERVERLGELEVGLGVVELGVERVQLGAQRRFALAQLGAARAELVEGDQLFLVAVDQSSQRGLRAGQVALEAVAAVAGWVLSAERLKPPVDLGLDQLGILQQRKDLRPHRLVDVLDADGASRADASLGPTEAVGSRAAVVVMHVSGLAAGGAAVVRVAAPATDEDALQERRFAQQLVLWRARALGLLGEHHIDPAAREFLEQHHLVGVAPRQPVGCMAQHDLEAPLERAVPKPLQRRPLQARAREPLILEQDSSGTSRSRCSASSGSAAIWL